MAQNQKFYKSRHTGKEIDDAIDSIGQIDKEMPTDIGLDENGKLILEHDGQEITGQKKTVDFNSKLDKAGGTITGNLNVQGNLKVDGTTTTVDTETLKVKDNIIVTNSDKIDLLNLSGLAINVNASNTFGIMYNPNTNTVDLGLGSIDENGKFTYNENEGLPLVIRDLNDTFTQDHLISWSTDKNKVVDSGIDKSKVKDLVDNITYGKEPHSPNNIFTFNGELVSPSFYYYFDNDLGVDKYIIKHDVDLQNSALTVEGHIQGGSLSIGGGTYEYCNIWYDTYEYYVTFQDHRGNSARLKATSQNENILTDNNIKTINGTSLYDTAKGNISIPVIDQPVPNNGIARYAEKNTIYTQNGAYARAFEHNNNTYIVANNALYRLNSGVLTSLNSSLITTTIDPNTTEIANQQPVEVPGATYFLCSYRVKKTDNSYEIRLRKFDYSGQAVDSFITIATNTSFGLYEPYIVMASATTGYVYYSKENSSSNQDIAMKAITINSGTITAGSEQIVISGTNQKADNGKTISNSRPGFSVITKLLDGSYLMLIESNVNVTQNDNPYVIQYVYIKDLNVLSTYTEPKTLLKASGQLINIPYVATTYDGRIVITYHSTENFYGETGDGLGIHKKIFNSIISANKVEYEQELNAYDFEMIPTLNTVRDQWSGGWGSVLCNDNKINLLYVYGSNTSSESNQIGFCITTISNGFILTEEDASVEVTNNSIMKRSTRGFSYTATPVNLDPTQQPTLTVNKAYVGNYVDKAISDAIQVIDLSKGN